MQKIEWDCPFSEELVITKLIDDDFSKEIRIAMPKDSFMKEHKAPYAIRVQVLKGELDFGVEGEIIRLRELESLSLEANIAHDLKAIKDSIIRLSLHKNDSFDRVKAVLA